MTSNRDSQRAKVYRAERAAFDFTWGPVRYGERFDTLERVEVFLRHLMASAWWRRRWPGITPENVELRPGHGARSAFARSWSITLPIWSRRTDVVLHELAHVIRMRAPLGAYRDPGHGWSFCETYLELVRHCLGEEAWRRLREEFRAHGVRYHKPRCGKPMTPEQREAAVARLAVGRARQRAARAEGRLR
jgi:putative metallohydrolase (TIGR04338 family)